MNDFDKQIGNSKNRRKLYTLNTLHDAITAKSGHAGLNERKNKTIQVTAFELRPTAYNKNNTSAFSTVSDAADKDKTTKIEMPPHLQEFKEGWDAHLNRIQPPLFTQMSPRSHKKLSQFPAPTEAELKEFEAVLNSAAIVNGNAIYESLTSISHIARANGYGSTKKRVRPTSDSLSSDTIVMGSMASQTVPSLPKGTMMWKPIEPDEIIQVERASTALFDRRERVKEIEERKLRRAQDRLAAEVAVPQQPLCTKELPRTHLSAIARGHTAANVSTVSTTQVHSNSELVQYLDAKVPGAVKSILQEGRHSAKTLMRTSLVTSPSLVLSPRQGSKRCPASRGLASSRHSSRNGNPRTGTRTVLPGLEATAVARVAALSPNKLGPPILGSTAVYSTVFSHDYVDPSCNSTDVKESMIECGAVEVNVPGDQRTVPMQSLPCVDSFSAGDEGVRHAHIPATDMPPIEDFYSGNDSIDPEAVKVVEHYRPVLLQTSHTTIQIAAAYEKAEWELLRSRGGRGRYQSELDRWKARVFDKDGIDLDPQFNLSRRYQGAIECLFYYKKIVILQEAFRIFRAYTIHMARLWRQSAANLLLRVARGFLARLHIQRLRRNIQMKREAAERKTRQAATRRLLAWWLIVRIWRLHRTRCRVMRRRACGAAAVLIQCIVRGHQARVITVELKDKKIRRFNAAVVIQNFFRVRIAIKEVTLRRKLMHLHERQEADRARLFSTRARFREAGAAVCISSAYRSFAVRERLVKLLYYNRVRIAIDLQRIYRGHRARLRYHRMLREKHNLERRRWNSAVRIQSIFRMILAIMKLNVLIEAKQARKEAWLRRKREILGRTNYFIEKRREAVATLRYYLPFRQLFENRAATLIQRVYRGHHGRVVVAKRRIRLALEPVFRERRRYLNCVVRVQRIWRGHVSRKLMRVSVVLLKALRIQCWWRLHRARKLVTKLKVQHTAGGIIVRWMRSTLVRIKYRSVSRVYLVKSNYVRVIQRSIRRYLSRKHRAMTRSLMRSQFEDRARATLSITKALSEVQLTLIAESLERKIGKKYPSRSGAECPCLGPVQALFVHALGKKGETHSSALTTNRLDGSSFLKLAQKVKGLFLESKASIRNSIASAARSQSFRMKLTVDTSSKGNISSNDGASIGSEALSDGYMSGEQDKLLNMSQSLTLSLFDTIRLQLTALPRVSRTLSKQDCDIAFNKCKMTPGVNVLNYVEFVNCLRVVAEIVFEESFVACAQPGSPSSTISRAPSTLSLNRSNSRRSLNTTDDDLSEADTGPYDGSAEELSLDGDPSGPHTPAPYLKQISQTSKKFRSFRNDSLGADSRTSLQSILKSVRSMPMYKAKKYGIFFPTEALTTNRDTGTLTMAIMMLMAVEQEEWMAPVIYWLEAESRARVSKYVVRIQRLVRRKLARRYRAKLLHLQREDRERLYLNDCVVRVQKLIRHYLARMRVVHKAQTVIRKYVPSSGPPFWHNPTIDKKTWHKPSILGRFECLSVAVPAPGLEFVVHCSNCNQIATTNCLNCEDSFCDVCFSSLHCKGSRKNHKSHKISMCTVCTQQMATKACITCALRKPKKESAEAYFKKDLSVTCDTCFCHIHDHTETSPEDNWAVRDSKRAMETSKDAYIVGQFIHAQLQTTHCYSVLVHPCEECSWRAAVWRCVDCDQVYCDRCLIGLHSMHGPFALHRAETLPYYSPTMHKKFEEGALTRRLAARVELVAQDFARTQLAVKLRATVKVQSWWRMILGARVGLARMKAVRLAVRKAFRLRRNDTLLFRNTWTYRIQDAFGLAPHLKSDTREETVLKRITFLGRPRAREYIWPNQEDWAFYRVSRTVPRKGVPRRGFDVGTLDELCSQARKGGLRLPGRCHLKRGATKHFTSASLTMLLPPGTFVRIQSYIFCVVAVTEVEISLDRRWRGADGADEIVYRMPSLKDEKKRRYTKLRHSIFDIVVRNPLSQNILKGYKLACGSIAKYGRRRARAIKVRGHMKQANEWLEFSKRYAIRAQLGDILLDGNKEAVTLVDLSNIETKDVLGAVQRGDDLALLPGIDVTAAILGRDDPMPSDMKKTRLVRETSMSAVALLKEAALWDEEVDSLSQKPRYTHRGTGEKTFEMPRAVKAKKDRDAEDMKKSQQFEETKKKIQKLSTKHKSR